ncbi:unnamed protein product [Allacma fusca]|uniref:Uncharacterized protein n=1 Tax=Allacma fusca TaxID=39272 RepID=A0A8J2MGU4_9HEXA|nr:unnamed protein product [Allacma fusca]
MLPGDSTPKDTVIAKNLESRNLGHKVVFQTGNTVREVSEGRSERNIPETRISAEPEERSQLAKQHELHLQQHLPLVFFLVKRSV